MHNCPTSNKQTSSITPPIEIIVMWRILRSFLRFYPTLIHPLPNVILNLSALTGSKTPPQNSAETKKLGGNLLPVNARLVQLYVRVLCENLGLHFKIYQNILNSTIVMQAPIKLLH